LGGVEFSTLEVLSAGIIDVLGAAVVKALKGQLLKKSIDGE
jgi:hypothetical protein